MSGPERKDEHLATLDLLRGLAALAGGFFHFTHGGELASAPDWLMAGSRQGWLGVDVFFVISGFLIPLSMVRSGYGALSHLPVFMAKRMTRLAPPYLVACLLALLLWRLSAAAPGFQGRSPDLDWRQLLAHALYLNDIAGLPWVNPVFWSLAIEVQFYLFIALVFPWLCRPRMGFAILLITASVGLFIPQRAYLPHYWGLFALGLVTCWHCVHGGSTWRHLTAIAALGAYTAFAMGPAPALAGSATAAAITFVRVPPIRIGALLGAASYSFYLVHVPIGGRVINLCMRFIDRSNAVQVLLAVLAALLASLLVGAVLWRLVESPSQKRASRYRYADIGEEPRVPRPTPIPASQD